MPTVAEMLDQAVRLHRAGDLGRAEVLYKQLIAAEPAHAAAHQLAGALALQTGRPELAIEHLRRAVVLNPTSADAFFYLGVAQKSVGQVAAAASSLRVAVRLNPNWPDALSNLGLALKEQSLQGEAIDSFRQALRIDPCHAIAAYNLGNTLMEQGQLGEAAKCFRTAIGANPKHIGAFNNLANVLMEQGLRDEAAACYETVLGLDPEHAPARWNRARLRLLEGHLPEAWADYEYRWKKPDCLTAHQDRPRWDGSAFVGKTILLHCEQGLGDTIQFVRYAELVKQRGGTVVLECPPILASVLHPMKGVDQLVAGAEPLPPFDVQASLLSLPGIFRTSLTSMPTEIRYLRADPALAEKWRRELATIAGYKVGIAWQGNPRHPGDRYRSLALTDFDTLARIERVRLVSLQVGPGTEQLVERIANPSHECPIVDLGGRFDPTSFADLAAALVNLDLVIAVDSAVAHLAGALGVAVWVPLPVNPDWRWLLDRSDSPWYPTMRLYRQQRFGDWTDVFEKVKSELRERASRGRTV